MRYRYSAAVVADNPIDPVQFTYSAYLQGREVETIRLGGMVKTFVTHRELSLIYQMCQMLGHIAVASRLLTRRQREKYSGNRIKAGRTVFYLFPGTFLPADVGATIQIEDGIIVYQ